MALQSAHPGQRGGGGLRGGKTRMTVGEKMGGGGAGGEGRAGGGRGKKE